MTWSAEKTTVVVDIVNIDIDRITDAAQQDANLWPAPKIERQD